MKYFRFKDRNSLEDFATLIHGLVFDLSYPRPVLGLENCPMKLQMAIVQKDMYWESVGLINFVELLLKYHLTKKEKDYYIYNFSGDGHNLKSLYDQVVSSRCNFQEDLQDKYDELINLDKYYDNGGNFYSDIEKFIGDIQKNYHSYKYERFLIECNSDGVPKKTKTIIYPSKKCFSALIEALYLLSDLPKISNDHLLNRHVSRIHVIPLLEKLGVDDSVIESIADQINIDKFEVLLRAYRTGR